MVSPDPNPPAQAAQVLERLSTVYCIPTNDPDFATLSELLIASSASASIPGIVAGRDPSEPSTSRQNQGKKQQLEACEPDNNYQFITFNGQRFTGKKRSRYTEERRQQVRHVREIGACLRCQLHKKMVSYDCYCPLCQGSL
jgi:hypothetical protein